MSETDQRVLLRRARSGVRAVFERHFQIYLDQMRQTSHILGHLKEEEMPREAIETLLGRFRQWR
jgi:hypothetical protein